MRRRQQMFNLLIPRILPESILQKFRHLIRESGITRLLVNAASRLLILLCLLSIATNELLHERVLRLGLLQLFLDQACREGYLVIATATEHV